MNMTKVITLRTGVFFYHMDDFHREVTEGGGESGRTSTLLFFLYNIKQQWPHPFDTPDGNPCRALRSSLSLHQQGGRDFQAARSVHQSYFTTLRREGETRGGGEGGGVGWFEVQVKTSVFTLL